MSQQTEQQQPDEPLRCECCGWPVKVVGDAAEGTARYEPIADEMELLGYVARSRDVLLGTVVGLAEDLLKQQELLALLGKRHSLGPLALAVLAYALAWDDEAAKLDELVAANPTHAVNMGPEIKAQRLLRGAIAGLKAMAASAPEGQT